VRECADRSMARKRSIALDGGAAPGGPGKQGMCVPRPNTTTLARKLIWIFSHSEMHPDSAPASGPEKEQEGIGRHVYGWP